MRRLSRHFWGEEDEREGKCGGEVFSRQEEERGIVGVRCGGVLKKGKSE